MGNVTDGTIFKRGIIPVTSASVSLRPIFIGSNLAVPVAQQGTTDVISVFLLKKSDLVKGKAFQITTTSSTDFTSFNLATDSSSNIYISAGGG